MDGGDNVCGSELLEVASNKLVPFPQTEQHSPFRFMLFRLGNVAILYVYMT